VYHITLLVLFVVCTASLVARFRRAPVEERQQLKWIAYAAGVLAAGIVVTALTIQAPVFAFVLLGPLLPIAAGVAILKYRLYDIDVVVNRSLVFGALAIFITAVYVAVVVGFGALLGGGGHPNVVLSLLATAIVALAFQPVRERVQRLVNQLVYGKRATAYEVMREFSNRVAASLSTEEVLSKMAETAGRGVGALRCRVRLFLPDGEERSFGSDDASFDRTFPVVYQGEPIGDIAVAKPRGEPLSPAEQSLLTTLAMQAGLVLRNVRLTMELQKRLEERAARADELRAARLRLVTAGTAARNTLEQKIQEATAPRLRAMAQELAGARALMPVDREQATTVLEHLTVETSETLELLRDLARGLYPPLLADRGLLAALQAHVRKSGIPATIEREGFADDARFGEVVESAMYFCCLEALQTMARRPAQSPAAVRITASDGWLGFSVTAAGVQLDRESGTFQNMTDRLRSLRGSLTIESTECGTTIRGRIPAAALEPVA
jgi:signal transduction histidine kinase